MNMEHEELAAIENLLKTKVSQLDDLKNKIKELREMHHNIYLNDSELSDLNGKISEIQLLVKKRKRQLSDSPDANSLSIKIVETRDDIKDLEESLNTHLLTFYSSTGVTEFEMPDGSFRQFRITAKIGKGK